MEDTKLKSIIQKADKLQKGGEFAMAEQFLTIEENVSSIKDSVSEITKAVDTKISEISDELKKKFEDELVYEVDEESIVQSVLSKVVIPDPIKGKDGKDYILTEKDKKEIAGTIKVPIIEKIVEKTEVIKELPIITNEIKEIAIADTAEVTVFKINELPTDDEELKIDAKHIKNLPEIAKYLGTGTKLLNQLQDVNATGVSNGDTLVWNSTLGIWEAGTGGGGGTPGGSTLQLQYNNAGAFGGMSGTSWNNTNRELSFDNNNSSSTYADISGTDKTGTPNKLKIYGGDSTSSGNGGAIDIISGLAKGTGNTSGAIRLIASSGALNSETNGGDVTISSGQGDQNDGTTTAGRVTIQSARGGDGVLTPIRFKQESSGFYFDLDMTGLTADRIYTAPDKSGTLAMLSDITGGSPAGTDEMVQYNDGAGGFAASASFKYDDSRRVLKLITANAAGEGALSIFVETDWTAMTFNFAGSTLSRYMLAEEDLSAGYTAETGSWATSPQYFWVKFADGDTDWGIPLLYDPTWGHIMSPVYAQGGSDNLSFNVPAGITTIGDLYNASTGVVMSIDSTNGLYQAGDVTNISTGVSMYIDTLNGQISFGNIFIGDNFFYDVASSAMIFQFSGNTIFNLNSFGQIYANNARIQLDSTSTTDTTNEGDVWYSSTQKSLSNYAGITQRVGGTIFTQTANKTVANTTTETSIVGTGVGSLTLPANFFIAGKTIRVQNSGVYSTVAGTGDVVTIKVKKGSTVLASKATTALVTGGTNLYWESDLLITCRTTGATGTVQVSGSVKYQIAGAVTVVEAINNGVATSTLNTTTSELFDITVTHSAANASNTITSLNTLVEVKN